MQLLGYYIAKPEELVESVAILAVAFFVLSGCAYRANLPLGRAAIAIAVGMLIFLTPDMLRLWTTDSNEYGNDARLFTSTDYSDFFFAITGYLYVGRGKLVAFSGMVTGLIVHTVVHSRRHRRHCSTSNTR